MSEKSQLDAVLTDMQAYIERKVAQGFDSPTQISQEAVEVFSEEVDPEELAAAAERYTGQAIDAHRKVEATWPVETECDRLDAAFRQLEASGIVARQNFSCCGTCGSAEIGDEIEEVRQRRLSARGYAFYHMQDTEAAAEGRGLYLAYGNADQTESEAIRIGHEIVAVLRQFGFQPSWDGSWNKRIHVPIEWRRRFRFPRG